MEQAPWYAWVFFRSEAAAQELLDQRAQLMAGMQDLQLVGYVESSSDLNRGIGGRDFGRVTYVARMSLGAAYIDEATAWSFMERASAAAHASFHF